MNRTQRRVALFSLDEEQPQEVAGNENVEETVEHHQDVLLLRKAIGQLSQREQSIIIDYFFNDFSLRSLAKKYGESHTKISSEIKDTLSKLRQYITDKKE